MKLLASDKKKIRNDWHTMFPELAIYDGRTIARRVGPFIQGVHLDLRSGSAHYRACSFLHNCAVGSGSLSLSFSEGSHSYMIRIGSKLQFHDQEYVRMAKEMRKSSSLSFEGELTDADVVTFGKEYIEEVGSLAFSESGGLIYFLVYIGCLKSARSTLDKYYRHWKPWGFDDELDRWHERMLGVIAEGPPSLHDAAEKEVIKLKAQGLPEADLLRVLSE